MEEILKKLELFNDPNFKFDSFKHKYTLDGEFVCEFDSIKKACIAAGISENGANISRCCHKKYNEKTGKSIVVKGFTYRFSEDDF